LFGAVGTTHFCTASVVHSPTHDLLITAGHCISGGGAGLRFVPGYRRGSAPHGTWVVTRAYVDQPWRDAHDPAHDVAFLQVAKQPRGGRLVGPEDVVGANTLGRAPAARTSVTVTGYAFGTNDDPVFCTAPVYYTQTWPTFDCDGFADGTSGSPLVADHAVLGVIGGLHEGGCTVSTSYSAPFADAVQALYSRAASGGSGDVVTPPVSDGC
jgi:V8-like Glu-specific endopeptidase